MLPTNTIFPVAERSGGILTDGELSRFLIFEDKVGGGRWKVVVVAE